MKHLRSLFFLTALLLGIVSVSLASSRFTDERFQGDFTTENLDAIIETYSLFDGWYWTTAPNETQTFVGQPEAPGWTATAVETYHRTGYLHNVYGCRWAIDRVLPTSPGKGGYGECFGFAQFIGYLLSGEVNPHGNWKTFYGIEAAGGHLKVGDIIRVEYRANQKSFSHSAVVYAVNGEEILFMQVSGLNFGRISTGHGLCDGNYTDETSLETISQIPGIKICRSQLNLDDN